MCTYICSIIYSGFSFRLVTGTDALNGVVAPSQDVLHVEPSSNFAIADPTDSVTDGSLSATPKIGSSHTPIVNTFPSPLGITHHMITCAKAGIFKPKALTVEVSECEPPTIDKAFTHEDWKLTA